MSFHRYAAVLLGTVLMLTSALAPTLASAQVPPAGEEHTAPVDGGVGSVGESLAEPVTVESESAEAELPPPVGERTPSNGDNVADEPVVTPAAPADADSTDDPAPHEPITFSDVPTTNAFYAEISWLGTTRISEGWLMPDGSHEYRPKKTISREAMAAFMFRLAEHDALPSVVDYAPPATAKFSDVPTDHEFYTQISWLAEHGLTTGYPDGRFKPADRISREAISAFMYRYAEKSGTLGSTKNPTTPFFTDVPAAHKFAKEITWMATQGITTGYQVPHGCLEFRPRNKATREAIAAFTYRLANGGESLATPDCVPPPPKPTPPKLPPVKRTVYYEVTTNGTITTSFDTFIAQVDETLNSPLGWRRAGVEFKRVKSGGSLTVVLANANKVPGYAPSICSSTYSCRVGRYAIINQDRWVKATPSWNNAGASLRDYRHMVVNHEVGHWLDNRHVTCGGAGQKAPVMQQQSISMQGCTPNPWPLAAEITKQAQGISRIPQSRESREALTVR